MHYRHLVEELTEYLTVFNLTVNMVTQNEYSKYVFFHFCIHFITMLSVSHSQACAYEGLSQIHWAESVRSENSL